MAASPALALSNCGIDIRVPFIPPGFLTRRSALIYSTTLNLIFAMPRYTVSNANVGYVSSPLFAVCASYPTTPRDADPAGSGCG